MPPRKVSRCHQDLLGIINKICDVLNFHIYEYDVTYGAEDLDSFFSSIYKVQLVGSDDKIHKIKKIIVVKWNSDPQKRIIFRQAYNREYIFYTNVVPLLLDIQKRFKVIEGLKIKFPNCILASNEFDKEMVAISSLQSSGYMFYDRFHMMSLNDATLVMKNLAKLHALFFAAEKYNPKEHDELKRMFSEDVQCSNKTKSVPEFIKFNYDASVQVVADTEAKKKLSKLSPYLLLVLNKCMEPVSYSTLCHGDCWNNNTVFKYQGNRPVDVIFIDYQLTRYSSPVTDISYFLYMSTDSEILTAHHDHFLNIYYETLTAVLRQCNLAIEDVYPRDVFQKQLNEFFVLGLIEALLSMKIITSAFDEAQKMMNMKYDSSGEELFSNHNNNQLLYEQRINGVVNDFFSRNYSLHAILRSTN